MKFLEKVNKFGIRNGETIRDSAIILALIEIILLKLEQQGNIIINILSIVVWGLILIGDICYKINNKE